MKKWLVTVLCLIGSFLLTHLIPFSSFFRNLYTMIHESGHALTTLLLSGKVHFIYLFSDHSGVTYSSVTESWKLIPLALSGYMSASLFAVFLFDQYRRGRQRQTLTILSVIALVCLVLFVRNWFGGLWIVGFIVLNVVAIAFFNEKFRNLYYLFISFLTLEESVFGTLYLFALASNNPDAAGDAALLARSTSIPAIVWALLFMLFAFWTAKMAIQRFLRSSTIARSVSQPDDPSRRSM